ncbi:unnamed protein product [Rhizophagus irregularis]|uniref:Uncharacterized protein n=1 Tax=Rhizophagus irregularis TaxID=588596 RepID=A0A916E266_9GLOM|nr:unnamed protein product [Rhizophagus irregularis]CAB5110874.1 unnamed protein product [Rhizophagus irregularis]CAB5296737.1 unnamed protein product [Rhizophagus irregularis]CAB5356170.1 unnamed protein product [Rhizophagus irregularis]
MRVFSTSDLEADFRDPDELSRWLAIKSEVLSKVVEEEETMERISRTGLILSFNERLQTESDVENEFDLPPVDEIPLEQAESVE